MSEYGGGRRGRWHQSAAVFLSVCPVATAVSVCGARGYRVFGCPVKRYMDFYDFIIVLRSYIGKIATRDGDGVSSSPHYQHGTQRDMCTCDAGM